jgi:hypothetical protein
MLVPMRLFVAIFSLAILAAVPLIGEQEAHSAPEQSIFSEGEPLRRPVALSARVLQILLATPEAKEGLLFASDSQKKNPAGLFQATEVHLDGPGEIDLLIMGIPPMSGADNCWFWLVRPSGDTPKVLLFTGEYSVELMNSKTNGYRDVRSVWSSPNETDTTIYHFGGRQYAVWKKLEQQNPPR